MTEPNDASTAEVTKMEKKKKIDKFKVVLRRLPPYITWNELKEQLDPLPPTEYVSFVPADLTFAPHAFSRCYFVFTNEADVLEFSEKFNRYVFVDKKGYDSAAMVELAMYQKVPRKRREDLAKDARCGHIEQEVDYKVFLDQLETIRNTQILTLEEQLRNVQLMETANKTGSIQDTPLTNFILKLYGEKAIKKDEKKKAQIEKLRKIRAEKRGGEDKGGSSAPTTSKGAAPSVSDEIRAEKVMKKLGIGKIRDEERSKKSGPPVRERERRPPREKPDRGPRNAAADDKKKELLFFFDNKIPSGPTRTRILPSWSEISSQQGCSSPRADKMRFYSQCVIILLLCMYPGPSMRRLIIRPGFFTLCPPNTYK